MSKIQNIRQLVKEGKGNQAMLEYVLWYNESVELELKAMRLVYLKGTAALAYELVSLAGLIGHSRFRVDTKEIDQKEYLEIISSHHRYKFLLDSE